MITEALVGWIPVEDRLPISGPDDELFDGRWFEVDVAVLIKGKEDVAEFWACFESYHPSESDYYSAEFIMDFNKDGVTHWRPLKQPKPDGN